MADGGIQEVKIVHFTAKHADVRATKAALYARKHGHDVAIVRYTPNSNLLALHAGGLLHGRLSYYVAAGRDGPALSRLIAKELGPDVVHCHELDQLFALTQHASREAQERIVLDQAPFAEAGLEIVPPPFPVVQDFHEDELGMAVHYQALKREREARAWIEEATMSVPAQILVVSQGLCDRLWARQEAWRNDFGPCHVVTNAPPAQRRGPHRGAAMKVGVVDPEKTNVFFAGYASAERKIHELCATVHALGDAWQLYVLGDTRAMGDFVRSSIQNVHGRIVEHHPYPHAHAQGVGLNMLDVLSCADVGYAGAELEIPNWQIGLPNKVFEYAFANVPIVASDMPDVTELLDRYSIGCTFDGTPRDLMTKMPEAIDLGRRAKRSGAFADFRNEQNYDVTGGPTTLDAYREALEG